jgi:hypothetical protein
MGQHGDEEPYFLSGKGDYQWLEYALGWPPLSALYVTDEA